MVHQRRDSRTLHPGRRRYRPRTPEVLALGALLAVIAAAGALGVAIAAWHGISPAGRHAQPPTKHAETLKVEFAAALAPTRAVYRYSVIEGGAFSPDELAAAIQRDPLVADHYRAIHAERLRAEIVDADRAVYVSYKRGNKIYWTAHTLLLRKGETILTDGVTQVRSRCGNCISLQPMLPTADDARNEPEAVEFDALAPGPVSLPIGDSPAVIGQAPFTLADVIAAGLVGGVPSGLIAENLGGTALGNLPASAAGGFGTADLSVPPLAGDVPSFGDVSFPGVPRLPGVPSVPGVPGSPGPGVPSDVSFPSVPGVPGVPGSPGVPGDVPGNPTGQTPPPVLVVLPPPFGPPGGTPGNVTPTDVPPNAPAGPVPVPEPGTVLLVGSGALSMMLRRLRSKG